MRNLSTFRATQQQRNDFREKLRQKQEQFAQYNKVLIELTSSLHNKQQVLMSCCKK